MRLSGPELPKKSEKCLFAQGVAQPGARVGPFLPRLVDRDAQGGRDLLLAQPGEAMQLDDARGQRILGGESLQRLVQRDQIFVRGRSWVVLKLGPLQLTAVFDPSLRAYPDNPIRL